MPIRYLFHPIVLFAVPSLLAFITWYVTPEAWFREIGITGKVALSSLIIPWSLSCCLFTIGYLLRKATFTVSASRNVPNRRADEQAQWLTIGFGTLSMLVLVLIVIRGFGLSGLFQPYSVRQSYVGGVTTFTLLSSASIILGGCIYFIKRSLESVCIIPLIVAIVYALYRSVYAYERVALLIPMIALASCYCMSRYRVLTTRIVVIAASAFLAAVGIFVLAEYFRTYGIKLAYGERINENPIFYGLQRFVMYFATSVNSGGAEYEHFRSAGNTQPLFSTTFSPLATILYSILGITPATSAGTISSTDIAISMGLFNPEFNNRWGVITPFSEGMLAGSLFWLAWGWFGTQLYLNVTKERPDAWSLALFGIFVAAFIDNQSRVGLLAAPHFLVPFIWLVGLQSVYRIIGFTDAIRVTSFHPGRNISIVRPRSTTRASNVQV